MAEEQQGPQTDLPPQTAPPPEPQPQQVQRPAVHVQNNQPVLDAITALPEKLVDAVREFTQHVTPPTPPEPPQQQQQQQQSPQPAPQQEVARRRTVGDWFFGVKS
jgi:hypothetical protein